MKRLLSLCFLLLCTTTSSAIEPVPTEVVPQRMEGDKAAQCCFHLCPMTIVTMP